MKQQPLFELPPDWAEYWRGLPSYDHKDLEPWRSLIVHFRSPDDLRAFASLVDQKIGARVRSIWYPEAEIARYVNKRYRSASEPTPRYPVYVISKGRWESRLTSKALERINVPYRIVVEPQERDQYAEVIDPDKILTLPFSDLGLGSIPARNWVWEHAKAAGAKRYWILDDNLDGFMRFHRNLKCPVSDGAIFRAAEDFTDRFTNVAISGFNYFMFVTRKAGNIPPFYLNTRVYSCLLIDTTLDYRWRGRYNEDTDLCIRVLKDGLCTILFNAFLCDKETTMTMKGGNTDELYQGNGRLRMAQSLVDQHPDIVTITEKFGRPQHQVNYKIFKRRNQLKPVPGLEFPKGTNEYGMEFEVLEGE